MASAGRAKMIYIMYMRDADNLTVKTYKNKV